MDYDHPLTRIMLAQMACDLAFEHEVRLSDMLLDVVEGEDTPAARLFLDHCRDRQIDDAVRASTAILAELDAVDAENAA